MLVGGAHVFTVASKMPTTSNGAIQSDAETEAGLSHTKLGDRHTRSSRWVSIVLNEFFRQIYWKPESVEECL